MSFREAALLVTFLFMAFAAVKLWKAFNSPDGERYFKRRIQGPFVPVTPEDAAGHSANQS